MPPKRMTPETSLKHAIKGALAAHGWRYFYNLQAMGSYKGIADFTIFRDSRLIYLEAKTRTGVQSKYQKDFQAMLEGEGIEYMIVDDIDTFMAWLREQDKGRAFMKEDR